jgi:voltage-gated potassium channel Kch
MHPHTIRIAQAAAALLAFGTVAFQKLEGLSPVDSFYLSGITLTTVGYGDYFPKSNEGKAFMMAFSILGVGLFGSVVTLVAEWRDRMPGTHAGGFVGMLVTLGITCGVGVLVHTGVDGFDDVCGSGGKPLSTFDALYFSIVSATTVGYGDICPESDSAKIASVFFAFFSLGAMAVVCDEFKDFINEQLIAVGVDSPATRIFLAASGLMATGTALFQKYEGLSSVDAFYTTGITLTSVGYGDFSPSTDEGKIMMVTLTMFGLGIFGGVVEEVGKWRDSLPMQQGTQGMITTLVVTCAAGVAIFSNIPMTTGGVPLSPMDAAYFTVVTATTVGYGDICPETDQAKLVTIFFAFASLGAMGFVCDVTKDMITGEQSGLVATKAKKA